MKDDYWSGATWIYVATITNDGSNSGNHDYEIEPGAGSELEVIAGQITQGDTSARNVFAQVQTATGGSTVWTFLPTTSVGAGTFRSIPTAEATADSGAVAAGPRFFISGQMTLFVRVASVAVSQDSALRIACRFRGASVPTVTLTSPTGASESVVINQVV